MKEEKVSNTGSIEQIHVKLFFVSFSIYHHSADEIFLQFQFFFPQRQIHIHVVNFVSPQKQKKGEEKKGEKTL